MEINRIYWGDSFVLDKEIPDKSVDLILEDMPYGTTACKWDQGKITEKQNDFLEWINSIPFKEEHLEYLELFYGFFNKLFKLPIDLTEYWESRKRIIKDNGAIVLTGSQPFTTLLVMSNFKMFKYEWVWDKIKPSGFPSAKLKPLKQHENTLIFSKGATANGSNRNMNYFPQMRKAEQKNVRPINKGSSLSNAIFEKRKNTREPKSDKNYNPELRFPYSILKYSGQSGECNNCNRIHSAQKPVALFEYLIRTYTNEGDLVWDGFSGSGTTAVACLNTKRNFICIEKDREYFDKSIERITKHQQQLNLSV